MEKSAKIYISGHTGMVGGALVTELQNQGYNNLILKTRTEVDLMSKQAVDEFFATEQPEYVFHVAAKVGGIVGNKTYPADFLFDNLTIQNNVLHAAHEFNVKKLLFFGSVCIYPKFAEVPIKEDSLLTGALEESNEAYAIAKIAGLMLCKKYNQQYGKNFISVMPCNLYGTNDNFHPQNAHVIPMLMERFHNAKMNGDAQVTVWGTGNPTRDFLFNQDVASGLVFLMNNYNDQQHINLGPGQETSIKELANTIKQIVGFEGELVFDTSKPDGTPRRYLDTSKINNLGWKASTSLESGLQQMYEWYITNQATLRRV